MSDRIALDANDGHSIHARLFTPTNQPKGIIQVLHGLGEHSGRYERFAAAATARGFALAVHDHRGHGGHEDTQGFFAKRDGWQKLLDDSLCVQAAIARKFAGLPIVLLGHSMGSYIAQNFAMYYGDRLAGLIISASTWLSRVRLYVGQLAALFEYWRIGERRESPFLDRQGFSNFNKAFRPARTQYDWISRDEAEVDAYIADPLCGGPYTAGLWRDLIGGLITISTDSALLRIPASLPILITGGEMDPVGGAEAMGQLALHYAQTGHSRLNVKIYAGGRHEMLYELNRDEVMNDWLDWIEQNVH